MIQKSPVASGIPFDPTGSSLVSTEVNAAIIEVLNASFDSSKGFLLASYGGNANTGRYLEIFPGIASSDAPILVSNAYKGIAIVARTTSVNATCTIRVLDIKTPGSPIVLYTLTFTASKQATAFGSPASPLFTSASNAQIAFDIGSGSINSPHLYIIGQGG